MDNGEQSYRRYLSGNDEGLVELIRDYKDGLIFYLRGFTDNITTAEDLCEDTFVKIAVNKPAFSGRSSFKSFLYAIARNTAIDYLRLNRNNESIDNLINIRSEEESFEAAYIKNEQKIMVHRAMDKLKPVYKQVLWLIYFEEFSAREAAAVMGKTEHNVTTLAYRARRALKKELEKEGFIYENI